MNTLDQLTSEDIKKKADEDVKKYAELIAEKTIQKVKEDSMERKCKNCEWYREETETCRGFRQWDYTRKDHWCGQFKPATEQDEQELKTCPFCGGDAKISGHGMNFYNVYCKDCDVITQDYDSKQEAIEAWNRRA